MRPANAGGNVTACFHFLISKWHGHCTPIDSAMPSGSRVVDSRGGSLLGDPIGSGSQI